MIEMALLKKAAATSRLAERRRDAGFLAALALGMLVTQIGLAAEPRVEVRRDDPRAEVVFLIDGREAVTYRHGTDVDLPHFYPLRSPSGRALTVDKTEPYPHHRSLWFADTVELAGRRKVSLYDAYYSRREGKDEKGAFRDRVRHVDFSLGDVEGNRASAVMRLVWEMDEKVPVVDERRELKFVALGDGEYFMDLTFTLTASYGDVRFVSDAVHYAWPYVRMAKEWSVDEGGTIVDSNGGKNQSQTNGKVAQWVDYSNTVAGRTEGLALLSHPGNAHPHRWLTRDYGTFGPRREDSKSGRPFVLSKGESLSQRVGVLVHRGDVLGGRVAERYKDYCEGANVRSARTSRRASQTNHRKVSNDELRIISCLAGTAGCAGCPSRGDTLFGRR